ncbi:4Fe-4S dicluster domain-containing protein [Pseudodesulfovibrio sp. zrk46]|uniref:4Fe-4S dicluster domain-containing protein n=1 Tax=Pseudodesulfovibrio sp. zrk46 TaxID=2725288 RepID=UPI001449CC53|nr:4Fe-4S dicluster domain-containing protein [Pseudodesulfovibrio sp. zrk46]QJB57436.1 heterodisulfide reductase subunit C [Pseudodesulfovibrio sp. zrk46]
MNNFRLNGSINTEFINEVQKRSGQNISLCYQCGNCTAGCPYTTFYDIPVSKIMRYVQAGLKEEALSCSSIWLCATCESCTTRCPNEIDVAHVMDVLRHMAREEGYEPEPQIKTFWDSFLNSVKRHGRVFEVGVMGEYMAKTGRIFTDMDLGLKVIPKGKLGLKPHDIVGKEEVAKIFERYNQEYKS